MIRRKVLLLFTEAFANGGIQRFNRTLLDALEQLPCDCEVLSLVDTEESRATWRADARDLRVRVFAHSRWRFALAALRAIASGKFDEVIVGHINFLKLAASGKRLARRRPRLSLVAHGLEVWGRIKGSRLTALPSIDRTLCVSEYTAQSMRQQAPGIGPDRFVVFPNALANSWIEGFGSSPQTAEVTRPARYFLSVTRLASDERAKGIVTTLEAFAQIPDRDVCYVIAGTGNDVEPLRAIARQLGIESRVEFRGAVSDTELVALYRGCEAFVLPSGQEGFGIVYLEAMHFGAPVIAASAKGAVDVVRHEETGLNVPFGDVLALECAMTRMLEQPALRARLIENAQAEVRGEGRFTAHAFTQRLGNLLAQRLHGEAVPVSTSLHERHDRQIVFVNRYFYPDESATSRMLGDLTRRLAGAGCRVTVIASRQRYDDAHANLPPEGEIDGVRIVRAEGLRFGRGKLTGRAFDYASFHLAANRVLRRLLEPGDVVVAKTDPPLLSVSVARTARACDAHLVNWLQDVFPETATALGIAVKPAWFAGLLRNLRNASLRDAAWNVTIGSRMRDRLLAQGVAPKSIRVIPNWAAVSEEPIAVGDSQLRTRLVLQDRFVVGYSGNLGRAHEFDTLLGAARLLSDTPRFVFLMIGGGAKLAALKQAVEAEGLDNFRFLPLQAPEHLADSMAAADVHVVSLLPELEGLIVPSKYYGVVAAARPVVFIGDADGEVARELRAGRCGLQLNVGDSSGLAEQLRALDADRERLAELGVNARQAALRAHGPEHAVSAWLSLLASLDVPPGATAPPAIAPQPLLAPAVQSGT
jgi:colanic acid biosynthesis glycosyl transferase WcaI